MADADTLETAVEPTGKQRPLGIWVFTLFAFLVGGIMFLVFGILRLMYDSSVDAFGLSLSSPIFQIMVSIGVIFFSIGAWQGRNRARIWFLFFVTLQFVLFSLDALMKQVSGDPTAGNANIVRIVLGFLIPPFFIWYFKRDRIKQFYLD